MITVEGVKISSEQLNLVSQDLAGDKFTYAAVQAVLIKNGVAASAAYRAADRWLQINKKAGRISYSKKFWSWTE